MSPLPARMIRLTPTVWATVVVAARFAVTFADGFGLALASVVVVATAAVVLAPWTAPLELSVVAVSVVGVFVLLKLVSDAALGTINGFVTGCCAGAGLEVGIGAGVGVGVGTITGVGRLLGAGFKSQFVPTSPSMALAVVAVSAL